MSVDLAIGKPVGDLTTEQGIMDGVAVHTTSRTLIGRDAELTEIASSLGVRSSADRADGPARERTHVLVSGDAGVGKTRLLVELRDLAVAEGWRVVAGHCLDFGDSALPYLPFSEVLGRLEVELPEVVQRVAEAHPALARLQPGRRVLVAGPGSPAAGPSESDGEAESLDRADLFTAVHSLLEEAATVSPVLLVIEDCHWADQSTRDLLSFLFSRPFEGPVAIVASYRSDDLHRRHPLRRQVAEWSRLRGVERMQLGPLGDEQVRLLIASLSPQGIGEKELSAIVRRAEGNAFFVEELVGAATQPGSWVPDDLADVLLVRLDRLGDAARQVVRLASVAGRKVAHDLLVAASGLGSTELDAGLRQAVEMNLLVPGDGTYSFRHALLGEAVYDDLLPGERVRLHAQYAEALREGRGRGTAAELARHARLAHDLETALDASIRAGDEAMAVAGADEAAHHYQQALELLADPARRAASDVDLSKLAVNAADALTSSGQPTRAAALLGEQLACLPDDAPPAWRARMLAARAEALLITETSEDTRSSSEQALDLVPDDVPGLRAKVLSIQAHVLTGFRRYDEAQAAGLDALAIAERLDLHELVAEIITTLGTLKKAGPKEGLRARAGRRRRARRDDRRDPRRDACALHARPLLPGLGGVRPTPSAGSAARSTRPPRVRAALRAVRLRGAAGSWPGSSTSSATGTRRSADRRERRARSRPSRPRCSSRVRLLVASARGEPVAERARALRRFWESEGAVAIHSVAGRAGRRRPRDDPHAVVDVYDDVVAVLGRIWHDWFSARIRLAAVDRGRDRGRAAAAQRGRARVVRSRRSSGCTPTAARCSRSTPTPPATGDPRAGPG